MQNLKLMTNTIEKLKELKNNLSYDYNENYNQMLHILIDYDNEAQDNLYLYDTANQIIEFVDDEGLEYYVNYQVKTFGYNRLFYMFSGVNNVCGLYVIDGYGNLRDVTKDDFEYCINDAIERLQENMGV